MGRKCGWRSAGGAPPQPPPHRCPAPRSEASRGVHQSGSQPLPPRHACSAQALQQLRPRGPAGWALATSLLGTVSRIHPAICSPAPPPRRPHSQPPHLTPARDLPCLLGQPVHIGSPPVPQPGFQPVHCHLDGDRRPVALACQAKHGPATQAGRAGKGVSPSCSPCGCCWVAVMHNRAAVPRRQGRVCR